MKLVTTILNWIFGSAKTQTQPQTPKTLAQIRERIYARCQYHTWDVWPGGYEERCRALNYLIKIAETIEDLKMVLSCAPNTWQDLDGLWTKWLAMATSVEELEVISRKCPDRKYNTLLARRWYALSATYAQIKATPYTTDDVLRELIAEKRRALADEALKAAKNCEELILQYNAIDNDDRPTSGLQSHAGWSNDEGLKPCTIKKLYEESFSLGAPLEDLRAEMEEKWRKSSICTIDQVNSSAELRELAEQIHSESLAVLNNKWDSVSHMDVEKAESEEELLAVVHYTRITSAPRELALSKISRVYEEWVERSNAIDELLMIGYRARDLELKSALIAAIEKYIRLAMTEEELRRAWDITEDYPDLRKVLAEKLSSLIK